MAENKWLTVLITLVMGVINPVITGRGPTLYPCQTKVFLEFAKKPWKICEGRLVDVIDWRDGTSLTLIC